MREADIQKQIVTTNNNRDRVELTGVELSHLHQQLQGITTTSTLIIGFAMASLSADLLVAISDSTSQFCMYKSTLSLVLSSLCIVACTACISACFSVIACVQIIIFESQRAIFSTNMQCSVQAEVTRRNSGGVWQRGQHTRSVNLTNRVVRMTQLLLYGDSSSLARSEAAIPSRRASTRRRTVTRTANRVASGGFTIYLGFAIALSCFFASTILLLLLFLSPLAEWRTVGDPRGVPGAAGANGSQTEELGEHLVQTYSGLVKTRCLDPANAEDAAHMTRAMYVVSLMCTFTFVCSIVVGVRTAQGVLQRYTLESLLALPDLDEETAARNTFFEPNHGGSETVDSEQQAHEAARKQARKESLAMIV